MGFCQQHILFVFEHKQKIDFTISEVSVLSVRASFDRRHVSQRASFRWAKFKKKTCF